MARLFHGPAAHGIKRVEGWSEEGIICESDSPAASWMEQPLRSGWLADPLALDVAFQMMILWSFEARGVGSLPTGVVRYRQFTRAFPASGVRIEARVTGCRPTAATATMDFWMPAVPWWPAWRDTSACWMPALEKSFAHNELEQATCRPWHLPCLRLATQGPQTLAGNDSSEDLTRSAQRRHESAQEARIELALAFVFFVPSSRALC